MIARSRRIQSQPYLLRPPFLQPGSVGSPLDVCECFGRPYCLVRAEAHPVRVCAWCQGRVFGVRVGVGKAPHAVTTASRRRSRRRGTGRGATASPAPVSTPGAANRPHAARARAPRAVGLGVEAVAPPSPGALPQPRKRQRVSTPRVGADKVDSSATEAMGDPAPAAAATAPDSGHATAGGDGKRERWPSRASLRRLVRNLIDARRFREASFYADKLVGVGDGCAAVYG